MESGIFTILNRVALVGWTLVLYIVLRQSTDTWTLWTNSFFHININDSSTLSSSSSFVRPPIINLLLSLEVICFIEVGRIAIGQLKGNLVLGVVLHMIRMSCLLLVLPNGIVENELISTLVLYSWSLTEVGRYPMYLFPSKLARYVRLVLPLFTFPLGAAAEAIGAYRVLAGLVGEEYDSSVVHWVKVGSLAMVVLINSLLGPSMAYPALLKKGLPVLMGKGEKKNSKKA